MSSATAALWKSTRVSRPIVIFSRRLYFGGPTARDVGRKTGGLNVTGVGMLWVGSKIETVAATLCRLARHRVRVRGKRSARSLGMRALLVTLLISAVAITVPGRGGTIAEPETEQAPQPANVFEIPAYASLQRLLTKAVITLFRDRRYAEAEMMISYLMKHLNASASYAGVPMPVDPIEMPRRSMQFEHGGSTFIVRSRLEQDGSVLRSRLVNYIQSAPEIHRWRIQRILYQSDLGYRMVTSAMAEPVRVQSHPFWRVESPIARRR